MFPHTVVSTLIFGLYNNTGKNKWLAKFTTLGKLEAVTSYVENCLKFAAEDATNYVSQTSCQFALSPTPSNADWREGQNLVQKYQIQAALHMKSEDKYLVASKRMMEKILDKLGLKDQKPSPEKVRQVQVAMAKPALQFQRFYADPEENAPDGGLETELNMVQRFYVLQAKEFNEFLHFKCLGCPRGMRKGTCKHVIALGISLGKVVIPQDKDLKQIGKLKSKGRPKKPKGGWRMDSESEDSDEEGDEPCVICNQRDSVKGNTIIFCDGQTCNLPYHQKCVDLKKLPKKNQK